MTIPLPVAILLISFISFSAAQSLLGFAFLLRSRGILETDKIFAVAGRYLLGFGVTELAIAVALGVWAITSATH